MRAWKWFVDINVFFWYFHSVKKSIKPFWVSLKLWKSIIWLISLCEYPSIRKKYDFNIYANNPYFSIRMKLIIGCRPINGTVYTEIVKFSLCRTFSSQQSLLYASLSHIYSGTEHKRKFRYLRIRLLSLNPIYAERPLGPVFFN